MDQLRNALGQALGVDAPAPEISPFPDPLTSDWVALFRRLGGEVPRDPSLGQLLQRSDALARQLKEAGRTREGAELRRAREDFQRDREKRAWGAVKERFSALALPEKAYRALRQEEADPVAVLARLAGRRGEELRGAGAARVRDALSK